MQTFCRTFSGSAPIGNSSKESHLTHPSLPTLRVEPLASDKQLQLLSLDVQLLRDIRVELLETLLVEVGHQWWPGVSTGEEGMGLELLS